MSARKSARHPRFRAKYRIRNWPEYEAGLKRRGGQARYSGLAIEFVLTLRLVFHLALRQAEGLVSSVLQLQGLNLPVPDHTTLSRRSREFAGRKGQIVSRRPLHLVIDSSGLQLFGRGAWNAEKHGRARRSWRMFHLAVDATTGEIVASVLTNNDVHDAGQVPVLLAQIQGEIASVMADGAYDGEPVYRAIHARQSEPPPLIIIPPRAGAVESAGASPMLSQRDDQVRLIQEQGRATWRRSTEYGKRSLVETAIGRYKALVGPRLRARAFLNQQGEVALAAEVLNRIMRMGKPVSMRVA